jgi:magnesium-transporting ATPase (P-type)
LIECDYYLLGCSAIEDQLQNKVPRTIHEFLKIGIKVWVLTGDKPDTAVSIAFASKLITHKFIIIDFKNKISTDEIRSTIEESLLKICANSKEKYALVVITEDIELIMSEEELTNKVPINIIKLVL